MDTGENRRSRSPEADSSRYQVVSNKNQEPHQKSLTNRAWAKYYAVVNLYFEQLNMQHKQIECVDCQNLLTPKTFVIAKCLCNYCDTCAYHYTPNKTPRICKCGEKLLV